MATQESLGKTITPQCAVLGVDEVGCAAVFYLRDTRLTDYLQQDNPLLDRALHLHTHQNELQLSENVVILVLLLNGTFESIKEARYTSEKVKAQNPNILLVIGILVDKTDSTFSEISSYVECIFEDNVSVIFITTHPNKPNYQLLAQLVVVVTNPLLTQGLIGVDWADFNAFFVKDGLGFLGFGEAERSSGAVELASQTALHHLEQLDGSLCLLIQAGDFVGMDDIYTANDILNSAIAKREICPSTRTATDDVSKIILMDGTMPVLGDKVEISIIVK